MSNDGTGSKQPDGAKPSTKTLTFGIAIVLGGILLAVAIAGIGSSKSARTRERAATARAPAPTPVPLEEGRSVTIKDPRYHGTWELNAFTDTHIDSHRDRPRDARQWLPENTKIWAFCVHRGANYEVIRHGTRELWHWWAHLANFSWAPIAVLGEPAQDGRHGFNVC